MRMRFWTAVNVEASFWAVMRWRSMTTWTALFSLPETKLQMLTTCFLVCAYAHTFVCMHACVCVCVRACMCACMRVRAWLRACVCLNVCMCVHACMHVCAWCVYVCTVLVLLFCVILYYFKGMYECIFVFVLCCCITVLYCYYIVVQCEALRMYDLCQTNTILTDWLNNTILILNRQQSHPYLR